MAENMLKFLRGNVANLPQTATPGALYFTKDEGVYLGLENGTYHRYGDFITVADVKSLPATGAHETCMYYCTSENILARYDSVKGWIQINKQPTAEELKTLLGLGSLAYLSEVSEDNLNAALKEKVNAAAEGNHSHNNKALLDTYTQTEANLADAVAKKHAHTFNETELNKIVEGDVAKWNASEQNAKDYADDQIEALDLGTMSKETAEDYVKKADAVGYNDILTKTEAQGAYQAKGEYYTKTEADEAFTNSTEVDGQIDAKIAALDLANTYQAKGDYAAEVHTHTASEIADFATEVAKVKVTNAGAADTASKVDNALTVKVGGVDVVFDGSSAKTADIDSALALKADKSVVDAMYTNTQIDTAVQGAKDYAKGLVDAIPAQTDYTVTITETTDGLADSIAKKYTFTQNGAEIGSINLAKELVVTSGSVKEVTEADAPYTGAVVGDKYIELVIANQDTPIYVPAKDLVDIYTAKDGAAEVQVAISNTNEISATLVNGGITEAKLAEDVKTKLNKTWEEVGVAAGLVSALENGQVKTNKEDIAAINNAETGILKQAKDYADGLNGAMDTRVTVLEGIDHDAYIAADTVLKTEVNGYTDGKVQELADGQVKTNTEEIAKKANAADVYAKTETYSKEEVEALFAWGSF